MRNLAKNGLSMTAAQAVSNLCNQRVKEIDFLLDKVNNASRSIDINGKTIVETEGTALPENVAELILTKGKYRAVQAFLMESLKSKEALLKSIKDKNIVFNEEYPEQEELKEAVLEDEVYENFGWSKLTDSEMNEYWEQEAIASTIGLFIHKGGKLSRLRNELSELKGIEWFEVETGKLSPVTITKHHTAGELLDIHETLAELHRQAENKVNYYKAKVKNLVSAENARINNANAKAIADAAALNEPIRQKYVNDVKEYTERRKEFIYKASEEKEKALNEASALKITVPERFKEIVDDFLPKLGE